MRVCQWVAPKANNIEDISRGVLSGENNGMMMMLDVESYDYVENDRGGLGFKLSVAHPLDMPIIEQSAVMIQPGLQTHLGVSVQLTRTSKTAIQRFSPTDRKCWNQSEISLKHLSYDQLYHYSISNCLFEAAVQEAEKTCGCTPGYIWIGEKQCYGSSLKCFNYIVKQIGKYTSTIMFN